MPVYRAVIEGAAKAQGLTYEEVRAMRKRGQQLMLELIAMVLGKYPRSADPAHQEAREALLGPIAEQNEAVRAYLRARRGVRDIDPDTGELEPEPGTPESPAETAPEPAPAV